LAQRRLYEQEGARSKETKLASTDIRGLHTNQHYPAHYNLDQTIKFHFRDSRGLISSSNEANRQPDSLRRLRKANQGSSAHASVEIKKIINEWQY
jgi:hypothetical protein